MSDSARSLEIARRMVELGRAEDAARAYTLALKAGIEDDPAAELEAALCVLQFGKDYQLPYTTLHSLHRRGAFREDVFNFMTMAFYEPNVNEMQSRYERNCRRLSRYPYLFRRDFVPFEELPIQFYPYDDSRYIPYDPAERQFGDLIDFKEPVIKHYFFKNLEDPILAEDIFSQYELEYLNDNVRKSEYVARENHVYLHYTDWAVFCAYLQCWNLNPILKDEKMVFLIEDEISQYPIDFKARFGIDYSRYQLKPIGIGEVKKLIWHTQLSAHNGGDFFNEIFDAHPNLITMPSMMMDNLEEAVKEGQKVIDSIKSTQDVSCVKGWAPQYVRELYLMKSRSEKDLLVSYYINRKEATAGLDRNSRIAPALFFQPHFSNIQYNAEVSKDGRAVLYSKQYDQIRRSPIFRHFKYIKTFTPFRRMTTSYGATIKFMLRSAGKRVEGEDGKTRVAVVTDVLTNYTVNRSYMSDPDDRLFKDSRLVRFEDGKLNPKATFTALAEFLDLPYTESLTYCSEYGKRDFHTEGNVDGFDPATVYRTYDDYTNDTERYLLEYFCRDTYRQYGLDFHYYDGGKMTPQRLKELLDGCTTLDGFIRWSYEEYYRDKLREKTDLTEEERAERLAKRVDGHMKIIKKEQLLTAGILLEQLHYINRRNQPLRFMEQLELDPALLEQPLYH